MGQLGQRPLSLAQGDSGQASRCLSGDIRARMQAKQAEHSRRGLREGVI